MKTIALSGGFDPTHVGHLRMMQEASKFGHVIIILNSDVWLMRKKGYIFMSYEERKEILEGFSCVSEVVSVDDSDNTVCEAIDRLRPDYFGNGGDRKNDNVPELDLCKKLGIELVWNLGGPKIQSSSDLVQSTLETTEKSS
jgi:cytidyltransferase-like protein